MAQSDAQSYKAGRYSVQPVYRMVFDPYGKDTIVQLFRGWDDPRLHPTHQRI